METTESSSMVSEELLSSPETISTESTPTDLAIDSSDSSDNTESTDNPEVDQTNGPTNGDDDHLETEVNFQGEINDIYREIPSSPSNLEEATSFLNQLHHEPLVKVRIPIGIYRSPNFIKATTNRFFKAIVDVSVAQDGPRQDDAGAQARASQEYKQLLSGTIDPRILKAHCLKVTTAIIDLHEHGSYIPKTAVAKIRRLPIYMNQSRADAELDIHGRIDKVEHLFRRWKLAYKDVVNGGASLGLLVRSPISVETTKQHNMTNNDRKRTIMTQSPLHVGRAAGKKRLLTEVKSETDEAPEETPPPKRKLLSAGPGDSTFTAVDTPRPMTETTSDISAHTDTFDSEESHDSLLAASSYVVSPTSANPSSVNASAAIDPSDQLTVTSTPGNDWPLRTTVAASSQDSPPGVGPMLTDAPQSWRGILPDDTFSDLSFSMTTSDVATTDSSTVLDDELFPPSSFFEGYDWGADLFGEFQYNNL